MRIAITGPTGNVGGKVVDILRNGGGHQLVLLVHDRRKLSEDFARGAEVAEGDLEDTAYVRRATQGVDELFYMIPPRLDAPDLLAYQTVVAQNGAEAVRANGIGRVVLLSSVGAHIGRGMGPVDGLREAEDLMAPAASNLSILRPAFYMENLLWSIEGIARAHSLFMPVRGRLQWPMIATKDVADAAARALNDASWTGRRVLSLLGPRDYSFEEVADIIGEAIGAQVKYVQITPKHAIDRLISVGASNSVARGFVEMLVARETGDFVPEESRNPASATPTTLEEFARDVFAPAYKATVQRMFQPARA